jgi:hypothetical protein
MPDGSLGPTTRAKHRRKIDGDEQRQLHDRLNMSPCKAHRFEG